MRTSSRLTAPPAPQEATVLGKALLRAAELLGLSGRELARAIGVDDSSITRLRQGRYLLDPSSKPGELALLVVRVYRSLDALVGSDERARHAWLRGFNVGLGGVPGELVLTAQGLVGVVSYLDGMRAKL